MGYTMIAPTDWKNPNWDDDNHVHEWKSYASPWLRDGWGDFSDDGKKRIAATLDDIAAKEEWD